MTACGGEEPAPEPIARPVRWETVYATGGQRTRSFTGVARAGMQSDLSFRVAGTVLRIRVKVGDRVQEGDVLAEMDPADYRLQVQQTEASLERAKAEARNAAANYERIRALYENGNASRNDIDQARAASESTAAQEEATRRQLELARRQLSYTTLRAPVSGDVARVPIEVNENVTAGRTIVVLAGGTQPEVEVGVPEVLIGGVREGAPVTAVFDAIENVTFDATVTEVGIMSSQTATTFPVIVTLAEPDPRIRPGMAAEVRVTFQSDEERERYIVPSVAVGQDRVGRYAFVVEPEEEEGFGVVHRREVRTGELRADGLEVLAGLSDGDRLVTAGVSRIVDGQRVRLIGAD